MPVLVETFQQYDPQLKETLDKIYRDEPFCPQVSVNPAEQIENNLNDPHWRLLGARFNGKLIGAALLQQHEDGPLELHNFCIRELTRRRGAGQQFIRGIVALAKKQSDQHLICKVSTDNSVGLAFIRHAGFQPKSPEVAHQQTFILPLAKS